MAVNRIDPGSDARATWRTVNLLIAEVAQLQALVARQAVAIQALERRPLGGGGGGLFWAGEWELDTPYEEGAVVVVTSGTNIGTYVAIAAVEASNNPPENGTPWAQLPSFGNGYWI